MKIYDPFVIPFSLGLLFLLLYVVWKFIAWIRRLPEDQYKKFVKGFFSPKLFPAAWKVIKEALFHRKMYRVNPLLGYMHMSFAFGWFLLIVMGNFETRLISGSHINPPYYPIFFKFFHRQPIDWEYAPFFNFLMDLILLYVLTGFFLALFKRIRSRIFGMKKTTRHTLLDRLALTSLWLIFPLRLLAESFTSGVYHQGSFLTGTLGDAFAAFLPLKYLIEPAWWAYSLSLGLFFVSVPFSRYMHIPTEILLIGLKKFGIKPGKHYDVVTEVEVNACPRCGVCIDICQLSAAAGIHNIQNVYFNKLVRFGKTDEDLAMTCLMCGRCKKYCPVSINNDNVRLTQRVKLFNGFERDFSYLQPQPAPAADVIYFAGCMTHLTPTIKHAMTGIMKKAGVKYLFLDEDGSICCGRPLLLAGELDSANKLVLKNTQLINDSGAKTFVTSCPICYKMFKEEYNLNIEVLHHTQYLLQLAEAGKISLNQTDATLVYHDPCDLGRGTKSYKEPRKLLMKTAHIADIEFEKKYSLCCGGSLGDLKLSYATREKITNHALTHLLEPQPDKLITACPLCKKTFAKSSSVEVLDIAEWVEASNVG
jgi:Fe-S oxidoreductase